MKIITRKAFVIACSVLGFAACAGSTHAGLISFSGPGGYVDASSMTQLIDIERADLNGLADSIFDVNLEVVFSKCGKDANTVDGCVGGSGTTYNNEISFSLGKEKTVVNLVTPHTFSGQNDNVNAVSQVFDDEAAVRVGGSRINSGVFSPIGSLSDFDGQSALGTWRFTFGDTAWLDPLVVHGWTLTLDLREPVAAVPEPSSLALLGIGVLGLGTAARRRRLKATSADQQAS